MQLVTQLREWIPVIALAPTYAILANDTSDTNSASTHSCLNRKITNIFLTGLTCLTLYTNPTIFQVGAHIGFFFAKPLKEYVFHDAEQIAKNARLIEKIFMVVFSTYLEYHLLFPALSVCTSVYLASRIALSPPSRALPQESANRWQTVHFIAKIIFGVGLFCLSLKSNPNIFFFGMTSGLLFARVINKHIIQTIKDIWNKAKPEAKSMILLIAGYAEYSVLGPVFSLYSSVFLWSQYAMTRLNPSPQTA